MRRALLLLVPVIVLASMPVAGRGDEPEKFIRLGIIGLDTSHVIAFTRYLNDPKNNTGCRVVAGFPGGSPDFPASASRVDGYTKQLREQHGLEIVDSIEELCKKVDGVLLESVDGRPHLEQARIVIAAGKPLFVDKPVADDLADVIELFRLARENNVPCWSSSAMRYGEGVAGVRDNVELGDIVACDVFGSSSWSEKHPSLYLYGIHAVEPMFTVMGDGLRDGATNQDGSRRHGRRRVEGWPSRNVPRPSRGQGRFSDSHLWQQEDGDGEVRRLHATCRRDCQVLQDREAAGPAEETIEIYAFMSAADESAAQGGAAVSIAETIREEHRSR